MYYVNSKTYSLNFERTKFKNNYVLSNSIVYRLTLVVPFKLKRLLFFSTIYRTNLRRVLGLIAFSSFVRVYRLRSNVICTYISMHIRSVYLTEQEVVGIAGGFIYRFVYCIVYSRFERNGNGYTRWRQTFKKN